MLIVFAVIVAFWPAFSAGFIWDDDVMLTKNGLIRGALSIFWFSTKPIDYFPITYTSLWLEWRLWGMNPVGYHVTNVVLHGLTCIVLWRVFLRLKLPGAWVAALLFAIHPVNVESVVWIAERKNILAMFFYSVTAWSFVCFLQSRDRRFYALSLTAFLLSLLAKPAAVAWPVVALGIAWWCLQTGPESDKKTNESPIHSLKRFGLLVAPFLVIALLFGAITIWFQYDRAIGADVIHIRRSFSTRITAAGFAVWFYLGKALVPYPLSFVYTKWNIQSPSLADFVPGIAFVALLLVLYKMRRNWSNAVLIALTYFVLLLAPVLGFLNIYFQRYSYVADHWQYFSLPAVTVLIAAALHKLKIYKVAATIVILTFCVLTFAQSRIYHDSETLWTDALHKNPTCWLALNWLGVNRQAQGRLDEAIACYSRSLELNPDQGGTLTDMGATLRQMGRTNEAMQRYREAIRLDSNYVTAHFDLACVLQEQNKLDEAVAEYREAARCDPEGAEIRYSLGVVLQRQAKFDEAISSYRDAIRCDSHYASAYNNLGYLLVSQGKYDEAIDQMRQAVALRPDSDTLFNLGEILNGLHKASEAVPFLEKAVALDPNNAKTHASLGSALLSLAEVGPAQEQFSFALKISPTNELALYGTAYCLWRSGKTNEAETFYERLLTQNPQHAEAHYLLAALLTADKERQAAIAHLREATRLKPDWNEALNSLAWSLATSPDSSPADCALAVRLAEHAVEVTGGRDAVAFDALGVAWARNNVFSKASEAARQALQLAEQAGNTQLSDAIRQRLELYNKGIAYSN